jgi:hypothetical protein
MELAQNEAPKVPAINYFERDFPHITSDQLERVTKILQVFMSEIRAAHRRLQNILKENFPNHNPQCSTCALNESTDSWAGFVPTAYGFLQALAMGKIFLCHCNQPEWKENITTLKNLKLCSGFLALSHLNRKASLAIAEKALKELYKMRSS